MPAQRKGINALWVKQGFSGEKRDKRCFWEKCPLLMVKDTPLSLAICLIFVPWNFVVNKIEI
jgi:hypothetical protein